MDKIGNSQQVGQANVNGTKLQMVTIPLPPYKEQEKIIAEVENILSLINSIDKNVDITMKRAERLRQSILKKAFSGKLLKQEQDCKPTNKLIDAVYLEKEKVI